MSGSALEPISPPTISDIVHDQVTKLWVRCPECRTVHELWPKEMQGIDEQPENYLIEQALDCYLSHSWTPDSWQEAYEKDLVPESWVESSDNDSTGSDH